MRTVAAIARPVVVLAAVCASLLISAPVHAATNDADISIVRNNGDGTLTVAGSCGDSTGPDDEWLVTLRIELIGLDGRFVATTTAPGSGGSFSTTVPIPPLDDPDDVLAGSPSGVALDCESYEGASAQLGLAIDYANPNAPRSPETTPDPTSTPTSTPTNTGDQSPGTLPATGADPTGETVLLGVVLLMIGAALIARSRRA